MSPAGSVVLLVLAGDESQGKLLAEQLTEAGFRIDVAMDGNDALDKAHAGPDTILVDIMPPGSAGIELIRVLKTDSETQHIPVIGLTAEDGKVSAIEILKAGAEDAVQNPLSSLELPLRIRNLARLKCSREQPADQNLNLQSPSTSSHMASDGTLLGHSNPLARDCTEKSLAESQGIFRELILAAPAVISIVARGGEILFTNAHVCDDAGQSPRQAAPYKNIFDAMDAATRQTMEDGMSRALDTRTLQSYSAARGLLGGDAGWTQTHLRHWRGSDTQAQFLLYSSEFLDQEIVEQHVRDSTSELLNSKKLEAVGGLAGGIAHEFNNILTVIMSSCNELARRSHSNDAIEDVDEIMRAAERAAGLTKQLLSFSMLEAIETSVFDMNRSLQEIKALLSRTVGEEIVFDLHYSEDEARVEANPTQIDQVIMILVVNSKDAMPDGGVLQVSCDVITLVDATTHQSMRYVELSVTDTGVGMDTETQSRLFEPFFSTKARGQGTGLGLATCYGIVHGANGKIKVSSEVGVGTCVTVLLPSTTAPLTDPRQADVDRENLAGTETVLIVEDDSSIQRALRTAFEDAGYDVMVADDGEEALELVGRLDKELHLLFSDILLPGVSGFEVAAKLLEVNPALPVLLATGYAGKAGLLRATLPDDIPVLHKPFGSYHALRMARKVLDAQRRDPEAPARERATSENDCELGCLLVVDDEPSLRRVFARMFKGKFEVFLASNANDAMRILKSGQRIDAMLCDLNLGSGKSGMTLYEELKTTYPAVARSTLFLTGGATSDEMSEFLKKNKERVVLKPPRAGQVLEQVRRLLNN